MRISSVEMQERKLCEVLSAPKVDRTETLNCVVCTFVSWFLGCDGTCVMYVVSKGTDAEA